MFRTTATATALALLLPMLLAVGIALAAPRQPSSDAEVLERLPARALDPHQREMSELRRLLAARPDDLDVALRLARRYYAEVAAEGDPRYIGYAQAALGPWWNLPDPPQRVRVMRAILLQFNHQFDAAVADLQAAVKADPGDGEAWAWLAAIAMVRADYALARRACEGGATQATPAVAAGCRAHVDATTGHAAAAASALRAALRADAQADPGERLWALTRLAEIEQRRGQAAAAEAAYREALALGITDGYLLAAYADFLLDQGRPAEVLALLQGRERSDLLLLRLALAAKASGDPRQANWQRDLAARFDAARLRGDTVHQKEESRFALQLLGDAPRALALARENYAVQREPSDARTLLEAALAARQPDAAAPVRAWMKSSGIESVVLQDLAGRVGTGS
jgi:tetratricopeptide (TPR) repeat protein